MARQKCEGSVSTLVQVTMFDSSDFQTVRFEGEVICIAETLEIEAARIATTEMSLCIVAV